MFNLFENIKEESEEIIGSVKDSIEENKLACTGAAIGGALGAAIGGIILPGIGIVIGAGVFSSIGGALGHAIKKNKE